MVSLSLDWGRERGCSLGLGWGGVGESFETLHIIINHFRTGWLRT